MYKYVGMFVGNYMNIHLSRGATVPSALLGVV